MELVYVNSSNLSQIGYDDATQTLRVCFKNSTYDYYNVPKSIYLGLLNASSKGRYHHSYIKNDYQYTKIC